MEAIVPVGLVRNILELTEFGIKVVCKGAEFYTSKDGRLETSAALESTINNLDKLLQPLRSRDASASEESDDEKRLHDLLQGSVDETLKVGLKLRGVKKKNVSKKITTYRVTQRERCGPSGKNQSFEDCVAEDEDLSDEVLQTRFDLHLGSRQESIGPSRQETLLF